MLLRCSSRGSSSILRATRRRKHHRSRTRAPPSVRSLRLLYTRAGEDGKRPGPTDGAGERMARGPAFSAGAAPDELTDRPGF